jgi:hypothetical protein
MPNCSTHDGLYARLYRMQKAEEVGYLMRVLHTESSKGWGGQENRTLNELVTMRDRGHDLGRR